MQAIIQITSSPGRAALYAAIVAYTNLTKVMQRNNGFMTDRSTQQFYGKRHLCIKKLHIINHVKRQDANRCLRLFISDKSSDEDKMSQVPKRGGFSPLPTGNPAKDPGNANYYSLSPNTINIYSINNNNKA